MSKRVILTAPAIRVEAGEVERLSRLVDELDVLFYNLKVTISLMQHGASEEADISALLELLDRALLHIHEHEVKELTDAFMHLRHSARERPSDTPPSSEGQNSADA